MELNAEQKDQVKAWVAEGCGLSEIQRRLSSECGLNMTFMDVRFLVLDLGLEIQDKTVKEPQAQPASEPEVLQEEPKDDWLPGGGVQVDIDRVVKPGALVSGTVVFSDGVQANWSLDQMGRLALQAADPGYRPSAEDVQAFQQSLQDELAKRGF